MYIRACHIPLVDAEQALINPADRAEFLRLAEEFGALQENNLFLPSIIR